jgi:hypothetical protein
MRQQLMQLIMAGNPAPASTTLFVATSQPARTGPPPFERDDNVSQQAQQPPYTLTEIQFNYTIPDPYDGPAIPRRLHGWLSLPTNPQAGARYPAVLALNGHEGSAWSLTDPSDAIYWHGEAFSRRRYIVLALDMGHRPFNPPFYSTYPGDDPLHGNGPHPTVVSTVFAPYADPTTPYGDMAYADAQSDWEDNGERTWDAMRGVDYLLSRPDVDPAHLVVAGLSLGGEMTTWAAALDTRLSVAVPAGYSPDMSVMLYSTYAHACWRWVHADVREYIDQADLHALIAPRMLIVQTGKLDGYSALPTPYVGDKQVARRSRVAYGDDADNFVHYLHYDAHALHIGDAPRDLANPPPGYQAGVQVPTVIAPQALWSLDWQMDGTTRTDRPTLFHYLPPGPPPTLTAITPTSGSIIGGSTATIKGTNFLGGAAVHFGTVVAAKVTIVDDRTISVILPAQPAGVVDVIVTNPDGQAVTLAAGFAYGNVLTNPDTRVATVTPTKNQPAPVPSPRSGPLAPPVPTNAAPAPRSLPSATGVPAPGAGTPNVITPQRPSP